jgi:hypothetical protein
MVLLFAAFFFLTGCSAGAARDPNMAASNLQIETTTESVQIDVPYSNVYEIELPSFLEICSSLQAQIELFDSERYAEAFDQLKAKKTVTFLDYEPIRTGFFDYFESPWDERVLGPAIVATREFLQQSPNKYLNSLESDSRSEFTLLSKRVRDEALLNCGIQETYLENLTQLTRGRTYVSELLVAEQKARPVPTSTIKAADVNWKSYSQIGQWRWGADCSNSIGSCKEVVIKFSTPCSTVYVEANFSVNGSVVDSSIDALQNVSIGQQGRFTLQSTSRGDSVSLTSITCF